MVGTLYFFVLLSHVAFVQIRGQDSCVPEPVENIVLYDDHILTWDPSPIQSCAVDHYLIYINAASIWDEQIFLTDQTLLDVGHLPECDNVNFRIIPISTENIQGTRRDHYTKTAAPPDVNLDLTYFRLLPASETGVTLEWDVDDDWRRCLREFRLLSYNEDDDEIHVTMYMLFPYANINNLVPCTSYVFTVTALHSLETEGQVSVIRYTTPPAKIDTPALQRITVGTTTADLTWTLPGPKVNRCPVNALVVDGSPYFNSSYPVTGQNQINRPPINVHLTGLQPDTMYLLQVSANNTAGFSEPFIIGVQTVE